MPQELQLPDGRVLVIPDNITLDQRVALRNKLGAQYADIKTGRGMEQQAVQQSRGDLASRVRTQLPRTFMEKGVAGLTQQLPRPPGGGEERELAEGAPLAAAGLSTIGTIGALRTNPMAILKGLVGSAAGAYGGGKAGKYLGGDTGETVGKIGGGLAGGYLGATGSGIPTRSSLMERIFSRQPAATEAAAETAGSAANTPGITRVPEPRAPFPGENPANMGSVPREQLPALAQQGKPGAVEQLQQLGERPIITPRGSDIPSKPPLQGTLEERIRGGAAPAPPTQEQPMPPAAGRQPKTSGTLMQRLAERRNPGEYQDKWDKILGPLPKRWLR